MGHRPIWQGSLGVAVIGCGLIGRRRAEVVARSPGEKLIAVSDVDESRAEALAAEVDCKAARDWRDIIARDDVTAVVVSTTHNWLAPITIAALQSGKHVLVEKPMARTPAEAEEILRAAGPGGATPGVANDGRIGVDGSPLLVKVGFNHRLHPAVQKAHELFSQGFIGETMFIRCCYGHGGKPGFEKAWRTNAEISGGGELLDQGAHAIDLFHWFLGDLAEVSGFTATYVWMRDSAGLTERHQVEDNAFVLFRTTKGQIASLHASWTQWKNLFSFEIFGRDGYLIVEGLGGSYGTERLKVGRRAIHGGPPVEEVLEFPGPDVSWEAEWREFVAAIREQREPLANGRDGCRTLKTLAAAYEAARTGQVIRW